MIRQIFITAASSLIILCGFNCSNTPPKLHPKSIPKKPINVEKTANPQIKPVRPPATPEETLRLSMETPLEVIYLDIIKTVSGDDYSRTMDEIEFITDNYNSPQPYLIESQILRLVLLIANRAAYLNLADSYYKGWKTVLKTPDEILSSEERIERLANLSNICISCYTKHKETSVELLRAYDAFRQIPSDLLEKRLRIIALPFKQSGTIGNPSLDKAASGASITTEDISEAEAAEIHNQVCIFWSGLSDKGRRTSIRVNQTVAENSFILNKSGFYNWLADGFRYHVKEAPPEAFGDKPELREILLRKVEEIFRITADKSK